jgi:hypothetical protein
MKTVYWKVLFYDEVNDDFYLLGYTWRKKINQQYYKEQGYKLKDLRYIKMRSI